jgi:hypothetical protein
VMLKAVDGIAFVTLASRFSKSSVAALAELTIRTGTSPTLAITAACIQRTDLRIAEAGRNVICCILFPFCLLFIIC